LFVCKLNVEIDSYGRIIQITLISRRSRFFAGTRFLKRGVNEQGSTKDILLSFQEAMREKKKNKRVSLIDSMLILFMTYA
jgi:hypothetical protein